MRRSVQGFTLIELVVVITILGILAAVALPRFVGMQRDARVAKAQGLYGSIRSASSLARTRCELDLAAIVSGGTCTATAGTVDMDGTAVAMVNRYPAATATGIIAAAQIDGTNDAVTITAGDPITISIGGATTAASCIISYTAAVAASAGPPAVSASAPVITLVTTGC